MVWRHPHGPEIGEDAADGLSADLSVISSFHGDELEDVRRSVPA
jgi:hypothetical protein